MQREEDLKKAPEGEWEEDSEFKRLDERLANSDDSCDKIGYRARYRSGIVLEPEFEDEAGLETETDSEIDAETKTVAADNRAHEPEVHKIHEPMGEETRMLDAALVLDEIYTGFEQDAEDGINEMRTGFEDDAEDVVDETYAEETDEEPAYYAEDEGSFGEEEDADEEGYDEEEDDGYVIKASRSKSQSPFQRFLDRQKEKTVMDWVVTVTGIVVLVFAIVTGAIFLIMRNVEAEVASFQEVGADLAEVSIIGESGLIAVTEATLARLNAYAEPEPETEPGPEETAASEPVPDEKVAVGMKLSSIQKDLKIKFINKNTEKLIASVPFTVDIKGPDGSVTTKTDDDMDGIVYLSGIASGKYTVTMKPVSGYDKYTISESSSDVTVKDTIEYKKVDVSDEVKTESQVNVAIEETKKQEPPVESVLTDTVEWVESTRSENNATYTEIKKADIPDPATLARAVLDRAFWTSKAQGTVSGNETVAVLEIPDAASVKQGESTVVTITMENITDSNINLALSDSSIANVSRDGNELTVEGIVKGETTLTVTCQGLSVTCKITVTKDAVAVALDQTSASVKVGGTVTLKASVSNFTSDSGVVWASSDTAVATVTDGGVVTGVKVGKATITARSKEDNAVAASCEVTVTDGISVSVDPASVTVYKGKTVEIKAKVANHSSTDKVTYASSDTGVATVSDKGVVTGVKKGKATITVTCEENKNVKATCEVTVKDSVEDDTSSKLKDKNGNQLYYKDGNGAYHEAVYADYYKYDVFYLKTSNYKYTGWQTLDNTLYFFDKNGNKVTGEQVIQGAKYKFSDSGALLTGTGTLGIDVSKHNGTIDWNAVKNSGISYVIIRCGYRGYTTGALIEDPKFKSNIAGAQAAGLKVGIYFFTQAINEAEAVEEASMVIGLIKPYAISYPVFLDVEPSGGRADGISKDMRTAVCNAFCATMANSGYTAGIYANKTWLNEKINAGALGGNKIWLAQYAAAPTYTGTYHIWQYSSKGSVSGISGHVDMNLSYLGY